MAENRITKKWLKNHWHYSWWKYLLLICLCVAAVDVAFTMTAYRAPEEKKIEVYILNDYCDSIALKQDLEPLFFAAHPEQEELTVLNINLASDDMYASMQFSTYAAAQQGDVCLLPAGELAKLTAEGADHALLELTPYLDSGVINAKEIDLTRGVLRDSEGGTGVYAIPADTLRGFEKYGNDPSGSYLCILDYNGNDDTSAAVLNMLIEQYGAQAQDGWQQAAENTILF